MQDRIDSITSRLRDVVKEIRSLNPDKNWLLQHYWIDQGTFPAQATATHFICQEIVALNPTHLNESEVSRAVIQVMVRAVWETHFDDQDFFDELRTTVVFLATYQGSQEIHIQLQNLVARSQFSR